MFDFLSAASPVTLSNSPLSQVVAQIKFSAQSALSNPQGAALLHDILSDQYPRLLTEQQQTITAGPSGLITTASPQWRMTDLDGTWACVVGPEQLVLETTAYEDWSDMKARLEEALSGLAEVTSIKVRERIGLRYINHLQPAPDGTFSDRVSTDLLGLTSRSGWAENLTTYMSQAVFSDAGAELVIRAGTGQAVVDPPAMFVIDVDCYDEKPAKYRAETTLNYFDDFNDVAYRCFCACVSEDFRNSLK